MRWVTGGLGLSASQTDIEGRTVELWQHTSGSHTTTGYEYDRKGQLEKVVDTLGNEWSYKYDVKGRQTEARDPDKGLTKSEYNDYDDLTETTDGRGEILVYQYDQLGRKTGLFDDQIEAPKQRARWVYDTLAGGGTVRGHLTQTIRYEESNQYIAAVSNFTTRYQPTGMVYVVPATETGLAGAYTVGYGYSAYDGSQTSITYPSAGGLGAEQVTTVYNATTGLPTQLNTNMTGASSYVVGQQYTAYGEPTITTLKTAGGVYVEEASYYDTFTRRLARTAVKPETATGTVSDRNYSYDPVGNILSIADTPQDGQPDTQCFRYDSLRRLRKAWTPTSGVTCATDPSASSLGGPAPYYLEWTIDDIGNRTEEKSYTASATTTRTYAVPTSGAGVVRPHAVTGVATQVTGQTATTQTYGYDDAGNMKVRPGQTLTWDSEGHLRSVVQGSTTTTNIYDVDGNRLVRRDSTGKTLYLPGLEVRYETASAVQSVTRYYAFGGKTVGCRTTAGGLVWLLSDHQGTQQLSINPGTQAVSIRRQTPYGGVRGTQPAWPNQKGFVGGDNDPTGLVHIGAREYDAALGRFVSVDPIQDLADPQQWNAYAYANNSPVTRSDPTGLKSCSDDRCGPGADYEDHNGDYVEVAGDNDGCGGKCLHPETAPPLPRKVCGKGSCTVHRPGYKYTCGRGQCYWATTDGFNAPKVCHHVCSPTPCFNSGPGWGECEKAGLWVGAMVLTFALELGVEAVLILTPVPGDEVGGAYVGARVLNWQYGKVQAVDKSYVSGTAAGQKLAYQLANESARSMFTRNGGLKPQTIAESRMIVRGNDLGERTRSYLTRDGSDIADWGKYTTRTHQSTSGEFEVHFYYNSKTRMVDYGRDYKTKVAGG